MTCSPSRNARRRIVATAGLAAAHAHSDDGSLQLGYQAIQRRMLVLERDRQRRPLLLGQADRMANRVVADDELARQAHERVDAFCAHTNGLAGIGAPGHGGFVLWRAQHRRAAGGDADGFQERLEAAFGDRHRCCGRDGIGVGAPADVTQHVRRDDSRRRDTSMLMGVLRGLEQPQLGFEQLAGFAREGFVAARIRTVGQRLYVAVARLAAERRVSFGGR
jgi:hypothetical protein